MKNTTEIKGIGIGLIIAFTTLSTNAFANDTNILEGTKSSVVISESISKSAAKKLVKTYLKEKKMRGMRIGKVRKNDDSWELQLLTLEYFHAKTAVVNIETGKISFKKVRR